MCASNVFGAQSVSSKFYYSNATPPFEYAPVGTVAQTEEEIEALLIQNTMAYIAPVYQGICDVVNFEGRIITDTFLSETIDAFESKDFEYIYHYVDSNVMQISLRETNSFNNAITNTDAFSINGTAIIKSKTGKHEFSILYSPAITMNEGSVLLKGNYSADIANGLIKSAQDPTLQLTGYGNTDLHAMLIKAPSVGKSISSNSRNVTFRGSFSLYEQTGSKLTYLGNGSVSATYNAEGKEISISPSNGYVTIK